MANNFFKVKKGLKIEPNTVAGTEAGDIRVDSADSNKPKFYNGSSEAIVPTVSSADALTNKTIVAANNTITTAASGNLTSVELNAALAELQSDVDTRALSSDLSTHTSDTTTHGTAGDIVGTSDSQTLTNKTFDADSNTLSNVDDGNIKTGAAIARSKIASGSADHVLINDGSGVLSSEATLAKSRGGAGADMSSVTFPSTGTIVTRTATEDLSGKTFTDPITLEEQASSPSAPSSGDRKLYSKTDGKVYHMGSDGVEKAVGSGAGGGVNYHDDYDCDNIAKVSTYDDGAATPTDGTGGTVNYASAALETSSPLAGTASYKLSKSANTAQGEGWAVDSNTLDDLEAGGPNAIWINFAYKTSANYASGDVTVYAYRVGSGTLEAVNTFQGSSFTNNLPAAPSGSTYAGWITASSSDTAIRLILHVASTNATAYDIHMDRLSIGPQSVVQSGIQSDWQSYTPTGSWVSNTTYVGKWRRVGDSMDLQVDVQLTGAPTATALTVNLPSGFTIDAAKRNASVASVGDLIGFASVLDSGTLEYTVGSVQYSSTTALDVRHDNGSSGASGINATSPITFASGDRVYIRAFGIPISSWTSGNTMSTAELAVRSARARYSTNAGQSISNATTTILNFEDKSYDTHNAVTTGGSWKFTAPSTGYFRVTARALFTNTSNWNAGEYAQLSIYKGGSIYSHLDYKDNYFSGTAMFASVGGADVVYLLKDEYIDIRIYQNTGSAFTIDSSAVYTHVEIEQLPDLTVVGVNGVNQLVESSNGTLANYSITAGQWGELTSISLTPGTWDIEAHIAWYSNGATTLQNVGCGISTTSGNSTTGLVLADTLQYDKKSGTSGDRNTSLVSKRGVLVTSSTTYYLKAYADSPTTNLQAAYKISARRIQ